MAELEVYKYLLFGLRPLDDWWCLSVRYLMHFKMLQNSSIGGQFSGNNPREFMPVMHFMIVPRIKTIHAQGC